MEVYEQFPALGHVSAGKAARIAGEICCPEFTDSFNASLFLLKTAFLFQQLEIPLQVDTQ